mmetsp:Transcript_15001/g.19784  ORF Transcript_15001/g.19784 Transcript_15001/m.19784 type:complete len:220 (+) Transcript_15001:2555-3214(+)
MLVWKSECTCPFQVQRTRACRLTSRQGPQYLHLKTPEFKCWTHMNWKMCFLSLTGIHFSRLGNFAVGILTGDILRSLMMRMLELKQRSFLTTLKQCFQILLPTRGFAWLALMAFSQHLELVKMLRYMERITRFLVSFACSVSKQRRKLRSHICRWQISLLQKKQEWKTIWVCLQWLVWGLKKKLRSLKQRWTTTTRSWCKPWLIGWLKLLRKNCTGIFE